MNSPPILKNFKNIPDIISPIPKYILDQTILDQ